MSLHGDMLASSDDVNETHVHNWRTGDYAVLWGSNEPSEHNFQVSMRMPKMLDHPEHCADVSGSTA